MSKIEALSLVDNHVRLVKLHPMVVLDILNGFSRRSDRDVRVIGTLLGIVKDDCVEITDCFGTPHQEVILNGKATVKLDPQEALMRFAFHRRVNKKEQIVGWYATTTANGALITDFSAPIHRHYMEQQCKNPIHLVVDTTLASDKMNVRAFVSERLTVGGQGLADKFDEVRVEMAFSEGESTCLHHMINSQVGAPFESSNVISAVPRERERVQQAIVDLAALVQSLEAYVDDVVSGSVEASPAMGIALSDALSGLQAITPEACASAFQDRSQDLLMVSYVSTLTQAQIQICERLNSVL